MQGRQRLPVDQPAAAPSGTGPTGANEVDEAPQGAQQGTQQGTQQGAPPASTELVDVLERDLPAVLRAIRQTGVEELRLSWGDVRIMVRREPADDDATAVAGESAGQPESTEVAPAAIEVRAHMVGPFHRSREPDGPSLAGEGDLVDAGRPLGVIETLGMATDVEAPAAGRLERFVVEDGLPVEYGQVLAIIVPEG
jgi:acetyl-CoA carboxylase biotin carboxyl carrier protein